MPSPLDFITSIRESFKGSVDVYTKGSCYQFYLILKQVFPDAIAYYNQDHVITLIDGKFYDITGEVQFNELFNLLYKIDIEHLKDVFDIYKK